MLKLAEEASLMCMEGASSAQHVRHRLAKDSTAKLTLLALVRQLAIAPVCKQTAPLT
jgi:hypothetical protein